MFRRLCVLLSVAAGFAGCSGGGGGVSGTSAPKSTVPASISVKLGNQAALGSGASYELDVTVDNAQGQAITGTYATPVTITTSDANDTAFSPDYAGTKLSSSITLTSSTQPVFLIYDGAAVGAIDVTATAASATNVFAFEATGVATATSSPGVTASASPAASPTPLATPAPYIALLYVSTAGAPPFPPNASATGPGSQPIFITARDQNTNIIQGTYPSTVSVTINNATQLDLSLGTYTAAVDCTGMTTCANNAAVTVTQSGTTVFGNYAADFSNAQVSVSTVSTDTAGNRMIVECSAISFPLQNGSMPFTCQPLNPAPSAVTRAASSRARGNVPAMQMVLVR